jgi:branched-chain amino acid transport system permease protein
VTATEMRPGAVPEPELAPPRRTLDQDWRRLVRMGAMAAFVQMFIALSAMPVRLNERLVIESILSLGFVFIGAIPIVVGNRISRQVRREGVAMHRAGGYELFGGALVGTLAAAGLSVLVLLLTHFDLREPLVNWSPQLKDLLSFNRGPTFGVLIWLGIGAAGGFIGGGLRLLPDRWRRTLLTMATSVVLASVLEQLVVDLVSGVGLEPVAEWFYARRSGLTQAGAGVTAAIAGVAAFFGRGRLKAARARVQTLEGPARTRATGGMILLTAAILIVVPLLVGSLTNELLANVGLFVLLALGLNIVVGLAGILDLGYVAFFAVGSYTAAVLTAATSPRINPEFPWFVALIFVVIVTGLVGLFIGAPVIRMRGDYLAIVTLGFGEIIRLLFLSDWLSGWFGGSQGITAIGGVEIFGLTTVDGTSPRKVFYLVLVFCAIAIYVSWRLERSRLGRAWMAVREDETVAEAMGINTVNVKLLAFVVGAILGSFSGAIFANKVGSVFPSSFLILVSMVILVVVIFGGMGSIIGVIAGAAILIGVLGGPKQPGLLQEFSEFKLLIYGALLVWMMLARPEGLIPSARRTRELHQEEFLQDAWLKGHVDTGDDDDDDGSAPPAGERS